MVSELVTELVMEFTGDQLEMINETVVEVITGAIMVMITELTGDQSEMINEMAMEMTSELVSELIPKLIGDLDGCPLTVWLSCNNSSGLPSSFLMHARCLSTE